MNNKEIFIKHIRLLHKCLLNSNKENFEFWYNSFVLAHGKLDTQRKININELEKTYSVKIDNEKSIFELIFSFETYYIILMRGLVYRKITNNIINEETFINNTYRDLGINNYTVDDTFNWFLKCNIKREFLSEIDLAISKYDIENIETDFIKEIFEEIFPRQVRHSMGEFYTPDWLANYLITILTENDAIAHNKSFLDPTCGSGTFIFNVIKKFMYSSSGEIFNQVVGIDINPISVVAAKTNFLLLYFTYFQSIKENNLTIPIYYADTINSTIKQQTLFPVVKTNFDELNLTKFDYIVGNPPWVNWEYLPKTYREQTKPVWKHYRLFEEKGMNAGFIKEDISVLITYLVCDKYLKNKGKLGFVLKETLFKSIRQGLGFRKFKILPTNTDLNPYRVDDLSVLKPFTGAVTRAALLFLEKNKPVKFPVDYVEWQPINGKRNIENNSNIDEIHKNFKLIHKKAKPQNSNKINSGWITYDEGALTITDKILGKSDYKARTGMFTGGANGIFWLNILGNGGNSLEVENITHRAKNKMKQLRTKLEKDFVYPFLTGSDLKFWEYSYSKYILCPHTRQSKMYPIEKSVLAEYPQTLNYFQEFETELKARKGFTSFDKHIQEKNYYAVQRIGDYTFAKYKVAWRYISKEFTPAVVQYTEDNYLGFKNIVPNEKIIFIGLEDKKEAYFVCGLLSSTEYRNTIHNFMVGTQITPSIIKNLFIPKYDASSKFHNQISEFCEIGHKTNDKLEYVKKIDDIVNEMLGI